MSPHYDAIVVGAGFSGIACAIRLGMMGKKILLIEKHKIFGGLNSYYTRKVGGKKVLFDSGLHALTNFCGPKDRQLPLGKVIKQLRLSYYDLNLQEQKVSRISFPWGSFRFSNDANLFWSELSHFFPENQEELIAFQKFLSIYDEFALENQSLPFVDTKSKLQEFFSSERLVSTLMMAPMCYGSAWEHTMDWNLFICLFRSIFLEGLSRPTKGIQGLLKPLLDKLQELNVSILTGVAVEKYLLSQANQVYGLELSNGATVLTEQVYCSTGIKQLQEKIKIENDEAKDSAVITFVEFCIVALKKDLREIIPWTLHFETLTEQINYMVPSSEEAYDKNLLIWSCSANYGETFAEVPLNEAVGFLKLSLLANSSFWISATPEIYQSKKEELQRDAMSLVNERFPELADKILGLDSFTPKTIRKYTGHAGGAVYGSQEKWKEGKTPWENIYVIGADQGLPGIIGSMLSGITMANQYGFATKPLELNDGK